MNPQHLTLAIDFSAPYTWLLLPGLILVIASLLFSIRNKKKRSSADPSFTASEQIERNRNLRGMHGDLERIMVEIEQMAKRVSAQLDAKSMRLEQLLDEADLKIAQLTQVQSPPTTSSGTAPDITTPPVDDNLIAQLDGPATQTTAADTRSLQQQRIYELADRGMPADQIAHELNEMPGTVELILNLRQR